VTRHLTAVEIARVLLDGSAPEHARSCARCAADLEEAQAAAGHFHAQVFARTLPKVEPRKSWWPALLGLATATAAVVLIATRPPAVPAYGIKGEGALLVYAQGAPRQRAYSSNPWLVRDGSELRPGDRLRFSVVTGARYAMVASADGRGQANVYVVNAELSHGNGLSVDLPGAFELDDAPGPERFFALFSDQPIEPAKVKAALAALQGADAIRKARKLPLDFAQATFLIEKEAFEGGTHR
jgi:hypothetical protein